MLSSLSIDDAMAIKIVGVLCLAIGHLYWESFRCRRAHANARVKISGLESAVRGCSAPHCTVRDALLKSQHNE
jgi:hypothetical protein